MSRYSKYYLQNILCLEDGLSRYYVQDRHWSHKEILDVPVVVCDHERDAAQMLHACIEYNAFTVTDQLRSFLAEDCYGYHFVYRMDDREVVQAVADELAHRAYQVVIEPGHGWAVQVNDATDEVNLPVAVEPEPELAGIFEELKVQLDALVAEQQKRYDQYEAELAKMSEAEKAALYGKKAGKGVFSIVGDLVDLVKAFPGFYVGYLKTLRKVALYPSQLSAVMAESIATGNLGPLENEIDRLVKPVAETYDDVQRFKGMLQVLLTDKDTLELLHDFAQRYYDATHPLELNQMGASAATDIVVTVLLVIFTAGVGAAANLAAKSTKLVKIAQLLERLAKALKRIGYSHKLPNKNIDSAGGGKSLKRKPDKFVKKGMPELESANKKQNIVSDNEAGTAPTIDISKKDFEIRDFANSKEAYNHINNLDGDVADIARNKIYGLSKEEAQGLKAHIRDWVTEDDYPQIDYAKIEKSIDQYTDKVLGEGDIGKVKDYVFKDDFIAPKDNMPKVVDDAFLRQAEKWMNLREGKGDINEKVFLRHELAEMSIKREGGLEALGEALGKNKFVVHDDAHTAVEQIFDCTIDYTKK